MKNYCNAELSVLQCDAEEGENMANRTQIKSVQIEGYKSIKKCNIDLENINILIGSNGAGKSNFISAFSMLRNIFDRSLQRFVNFSGIETLFYKGTKETNSIKMEIHFGNNGYGFDISPGQDSSVFFNDEYFCYDGDYLSKKSISSGHSESKWATGLKNMIDNYVQPPIEKKDWRVYHFNDTSYLAKVRRTQRIGDGGPLEIDASNIAPLLAGLKERYSSNYQKIISVIRLVAPYFDDFVLEPEPFNKEMMLLKWKEKGMNAVCMPSQFSDGTLRFICLATLLCQPDDFLPQTIVIDEPEMGLHPIAITVFAELVKMLAEKRQFVLSTQSVDLLNEFEPKDIIVADRSDDGSIFQRLDSQKLSRWLEEYTLGDLWNKNLLGGRLTKL